MRKSFKEIPDSEDCCYIGTGPSRPLAHAGRLAPVAGAGRHYVEIFESAGKLTWVDQPGEDQHGYGGEVLAQKLHRAGDVNVYGVAGYGHMLGGLLVAEAF